jgi:hypothetical protein
MSDQEGNQPNEDVGNITKSEVNSDSHENASNDTSDDELLNAQLEAEKAISDAIQGISKTINS